MGLSRYLTSLMLKALTSTRPAAFQRGRALRQHIVAASSTNQATMVTMHYFPLRCVALHSRTALVLLKVSRRSRS